MFCPNVFSLRNPDLDKTKFQKLINFFLYYSNNMTLFNNEWIHSQAIFTGFFELLEQLRHIACWHWKAGIQVKRGSFVFPKGILPFSFSVKKGFFVLFLFIKSFNSFCTKTLKKKMCWVRIPVPFQVSCCIPLSLSTRLWMFGATWCSSVKRLGYFFLKSCAILLQFL